MPINVRMSAYSVWACPALSLFTGLIVGGSPRRSIPLMDGLSTQSSGRRLLCNPYPAFANCARNGLELRVDVELRQDVLHVSSHGVRRHLENFGNGLGVVPECQLAQDFQ